MNTDMPMQSSWTDSNGVVHTGVITVTNPTADNEKKKLKSQAGEMQKYVTELEKYLNGKPKAKKIQEVYEQLVIVTEKGTNLDDKEQKRWDGLKKALDDSEELYKLLYPKKNDRTGAHYNSRELDGVAVNATQKAALEALRLDEFEDVAYGDKNGGNGKNESSASSKDSDKGIWKALNSAYKVLDKLNQMVVPKDTTEAENIRSNVKKAMNDNYRELSNAIKSKEKLDQAKKDDEIENTQLMPFIQPFTDPDVRGEAIFAMITAALVDFFSWLIAVALVNKKKSILYFKKVVDLRANREEMLEDCLMYICLNVMEEKQQDNAENMSWSQIQNYVAHKINEVMKAFMRHIHFLYFSDELNAFGYISESDIETFSEDEKNLFYTLNNVALIHPCHYSEISKIINADFDEYSAGSKEPMANKELVKKYQEIFEPDKIYYLVSKNLHVWFCENFSELLQSSLLFVASDAETENISVGNAEGTNTNADGGELNV